MACRLGRYIPPTTTGRRRFFYAIHPGDRNQAVGVTGKKKKETRIVEGTSKRQRRRKGAGGEEEAGIGRAENDLITHLVGFHVAVDLVVSAILHFHLVGN